MIYTFYFTAILTVLSVIHGPTRTLLHWKHLAKPLPLPAVIIPGGIQNIVKKWSYATRSANSVTIDGGKGQAFQDATAPGEIVKFESNDLYDYTLG